MKFTLNGFTIGERIAQIADRLARAKRVSFSALIEDKVHREEVITTFLALLEMARLKLIRVDQRQVGSPLYIEAQVDGISARGEKAAEMFSWSRYAWSRASVSRWSIETLSVNPSIQMHSKARL